MRMRRHGIASAARLGRGFNLEIVYHRSRALLDIVVNASESSICLLKLPTFADASPVTNKNQGVIERIR